MERMHELKSPIDKYMYLRELQKTNSQQYYSLLLGHTEEVMPFIYTPTTIRGAPGGILGLTGGSRMPNEFMAIY
eukprot:gene26826-4420_t